VIADREDEKPLSYAHRFIMSNLRALQGEIRRHDFSTFVDQPPNDSETPRSWLKVLNPNYTQKRGRREMFDRFRERQAERRVGVALRDFILKLEGRLLRRLS
jgi:hypothetical protein